jgi:hypothetical protein
MTGSRHSLTAMVPLTCGNCGFVLWEGPEGDEPDELVSTDVTKRAPCPKCGSTARGFSRFLADEVRVREVVSAEVDRAITADRLTMFTFLIGIGAAVGLSVAFAVGGSLLLDVGLFFVAGVGSMVLTACLVRLVLRRDGLRNRAMAAMHWMTGR